jgi:hypothetical protein
MHILDHLYKKWKTEVADENNSPVDFGGGTYGGGVISTLAAQEKTYSFRSETKLAFKSSTGPDEGPG